MASAFVLGLCLAPVAHALGSAQASAPGQPRAASSTARGDSATTSYTVDGIHVIHHRTNTSIVVANLYLLGGVRQSTAVTAGLESLLLEVSERGTAKYAKDALRRAMARTGSEIVIQPREDWTVIGVRTTTTELDSVWSIFSERLMYPLIEPTDVEFVRNQFVAGVRQRVDSPDATLDVLVDSIAFAGHPYALSPIGTEQSLSRITLAQLKAYHRDQIITSRMMLVVVGDVSRAKVESLVRATIGKLPAGTYAWTMPDTLPTRVTDAAMLRRMASTNYVQGEFIGPLANSRDAPALRVAAAVLSGRLFGEIRSKRNLTYAVAANFRDRGVTSVGLYVTTTQPDTTVALMRKEVRDLQERELETELLHPLVQQFITEYFLDNETITAQADFLARAQLYQGDYRAGARFVADLRAVTGADVQRVARRYFRTVRWAYVGDLSRVRKERLLEF